MTYKCTCPEDWQGMDHTAGCRLRSHARVCRWCGKQGDWSAVCMNTRDMEEKTDPRCRAELMRAGGGEYTVNQAAARSTE